MKCGEVRTTACERNPITPRDSSANLAPTRCTSCAAAPVTGGGAAAYAVAPAPAKSSAASARISLRTNATRRGFASPRAFALRLVREAVRAGDLDFRGDVHG